MCEKDEQVAVCQMMPVAGTEMNKNIRCEKGNE